MGKSEPGCKQYFISTWEELVDDYWRLKYSEIWTYLSDFDESESNRFFLNAYPNPHQQSIEFSFILEQPEKVNLAVYDLLRNSLTNLVKKKLPSGSHKHKWSRDTYPNGLYFVSLQTISTKILRKITLTK